MCNLSEWVVRSAYLAYARDDMAGMLDLIAPDLEWTYRSDGDGAPRTSHGRAELEAALRPSLSGQSKAELEEVVANGDEVMVVLQVGNGSPAVSHRIFTVATVHNGHITALRACHDRDEARVLAGITG
jgi:ketosteroid isomerase-like protein